MTQSLEARFTNAMKLMANCHLVYNKKEVNEEDLYTLGELLILELSSQLFLSCTETSVKEFVLFYQEKFPSATITPKMHMMLKVLSAEFYFHKPITVHLELYLFYCFIHFLLYIGQY